METTLIPATSLPSLSPTEFDRYLMGIGEHYNSYEKFGAHLASLDGVEGVHFLVWAPNAKEVSVVGDFNRWDASHDPMSRFSDVGVWSLFIPYLKEGDLYKFAIRSSQDDQVREKTDPYAFSAEVRPKTASVVTKLQGYDWNDEKWMAERKKNLKMDRPLSIYEVHLGSWKRPFGEDREFFNYEELAHQLVEYVLKMGYTHIQLLPVMEHPLDRSWGYQIINYFAPTSRFGTPHQFMTFVDLCHQNGIGVLLDWVPGHFPRDGHGLFEFDGTQLYASDNWKRAEHKEWDTLVFDYGRNEVRNFLISNALFWLEKYHIDGLRVDAVASMLYLDYARKDGEWEPNQYGGNEHLEAIDFLKKFNDVVKHRFPGVITIAEESTSWAGVCKPTYTGGLGFDMKWNMGWMHDTLDFFSKDAIHRKFHQGDFTFTVSYAFSENYVLPISHDEVVHGKKSLLDKMPGDGWQKFANARLLLGFMFGYPGKKLLFMGSEIGQWWEWNAEDALQWHLLDHDLHKKLQGFMRQLNSSYRHQPILWERDFDHKCFEWVDYADRENGVFSFVRWSKDYKDLILVTGNTTPVPRFNYRVGVPVEGFYEEILNSDAAEYGGSGIGNYGGVQSENVAWHHRPFSINLHYPPLGINFYRLKRKLEADKP